METALCRRLTRTGRARWRVRGALLGLNESGVGRWGGGSSPPLLSRDDACSPQVLDTDGSGELEYEELCTEMKKLVALPTPPHHHHHCDRELQPDLSRDKAAGVLQPQCASLLGSSCPLHFRSVSTGPEMAHDPHDRGRVVTALLVLSRSHSRDTDSESRLAASRLGRSATLRRRLARLRRPRALLVKLSMDVAIDSWTYTARRAWGCADDGRLHLLMAMESCREGGGGGGGGGGGFRPRACRRISPRRST